jgi:hypothetical protein
MIKPLFFSLTGRKDTILIITAEKKWEMLQNELVSGFQDLNSGSVRLKYLVLTN